MDNRVGKWNWLLVILVMGVIVILAVYLTGGFGTKTNVLTYDELVKKIDAQEVEGLYFAGNYKVNVLLKEGLTDEKKANFLKGREADAIAIIIFRDRFVETLQTRADKANEGENAGSYKMPIIKLNDPEAKSGWSTALTVVSVLLMVGIGIMLFMSLRGKGAGREAMSFGRTKARVGESIKVRFNDVAGAEEEKEELKEIVEFLKSPKKFKDVGARVPKGVLLVGKPGTGKTLFAKAIAGEANVPFFSISGSDFVEMFVGVGASRVRDLFNQAKKSQPCIVFIDEIDAVGRKRGAGLGGGNDEREQTLNQLLVQMDGFDENDGVVIIAATNRPDVLDPALLRPGRFDRQITIHMPDVKGREAIFKVHARNKPLANNIDFRNLARLTTGFSGADIENLLNEAAILVARDNRKVIFMEDIYEGINKVIAGPQKKSRIITERDRRITAYHEAGHALVGKMMKYGDTVQEVSIIPRGMAEGYTIFRSLTDDNHITYNYLMDTICKTLGGRAAEEIIIQDISTGASQDIKQATSIARRMVTDWGMSSELKNTYFGGEEEVFIGRDYQTTAMYSDEIAAKIDRELMKIIDYNYERALNVINENLDVLNNMIKLLYEHETIYGDEIDMLLSGKSVTEVSEYIKEKKDNNKEVAEKVANGDNIKTNPLGNPKDMIVPEEVVDVKPAESEPKITIEMHFKPKEIDNTKADVIVSEEKVVEPEIEEKPEEKKKAAPKKTTAQKTPKKDEETEK
ncbi:MAG: ATP-dependent zinc metalloprotease FtsH [Christensenellales bacterium]|jgi:cell division protease FtsH